MAFPKIVYDPGSGPTTLTFQRAPRFVPAFQFASVRHDDVASSGVRESVYERADQFLEFQMEWVGAGADVAAWNSFMQYALKGGLFAYYADASQTSFTNYWLEDTTWDGRYKSAGQYSFQLKLRQVVT